MVNLDQSTAGARGGLVDAFGRRLEYLRLSVTDSCNFSCSYCLPAGCSRPRGAEPLDVAEIDRLVQAFVELGVWKVRITGGEPTLRHDVLPIVERVAAARGVRHVGMTTNGFRLRSIARDLAAAGLTCLNVSVDSLDPRRFADITGSARLDDVLAGVDAALAAGIPRVKVNAVLLAGTDATELDRFLAWARDVPLTVRFIELMQTGSDDAFFRSNHVPAVALERLLRERGWRALPRRDGDGPSLDYGHPGHRGRVGVIAPYRREFCSTCNRLRVSATGHLQLCLFADRDVPLRHLLQSAAQREALAAAVRTAVRGKPARHLLERGEVGFARSLAAIGG